MKQTTTQIYNLITNTNFENIKQKLVEKVEQHNWQIPDRQEYTYDELIEDLPDCIDILKQNIENHTFDVLPYNIRHGMLQQISQINTHLANIYANHQQFSNLQDYTQALISQIRANRLDFEARRIPRYKEKIKEYKVLIQELTELNEVMSTTKSKQEELEEVLARSEDIIADLDIHTKGATKIEEEMGLKLENSNNLHNQINALLATIQENRDGIVEILQEAKDSKNNIVEVEGEVNTFFSKIEEYHTKVAKFIKDTEDKVSEFMTITETIIDTNQTQQQEIDNQLQKAVGASLFSTFSKRKEQLAPASIFWLVIIVASIIGTSLVSYDIISDFTKSVNHIDSIANMGKTLTDANTTKANVENLNTHISWMWVFLKMTLLLPLIYLISFATSRYGKERRLIEEYAFKSTISLALTPYADLIKKIEDEGADSKYRDFLISSIENIFSVPTDKAFGFSKHDKKDNDANTYNMEDILNIIEKAKKLGND